MPQQPTTTEGYNVPTIPNNRPLILVSNDDGIGSKGIAALVEAVLPLGEVVVVAPDSPQSAMGHAITVNGSIRLKPSKQFGPSVRAFACSGTPADCVKLAKHLVLRDRTPDLVVSGINHGANTSISILYSGTMCGRSHVVFWQTVYLKEWYSMLTSPAGRNSRFRESGFAAKEMDIGKKSLSLWMLTDLSQMACLT